MRCHIGIDDAGPIALNNDVRSTVFTLDTPTSPIKTSSRQLWDVWTLLNIHSHLGNLLPSVRSGDLLWNRRNLDLQFSAAAFGSAAYLTTSVSVCGAEASDAVAVNVRL